MMKRTLSYCILIAAFLVNGKLLAQKISRSDSLRGALTAERVWWDLLHYQIAVQVDIPNQFLSGTNGIRYKVLKEKQVMQLELQSPMMITKITQDGRQLTFHKEDNSYLIHLKKAQQVGQVEQLDVEFKGKPRVAQNPPWDGGFKWAQDSNRKPFVANANQGPGASLWLPSKEHPYDEPDEGMDIQIKTTSDLVSVSNGRLIKKVNEGAYTTSHWKVVNPINTYGININIGNYSHFSETYPGEKGELDCNYYVLTQHLEKAKIQFQQVPKMLEAFEHWFGPYPFYEDGYKLVEVPYLGMEHQSSVTYGNKYENGYLGGDLSNSGWGLKFDFIIIHESGHEWFANSLTNSDVADMWIHEGFTTYSEILYLDYHFGKIAGNEYLIGYRKRTQNDRPIIGVYDRRQRGSGDMYIKGASLIHTLRQVINDDEQFRNLLRAINREFYHQTLSSAQLEEFIMKKTGLDLKGFFDQYLRTTMIPVLQYRVKQNSLEYRFRQVVDGFKIPVRIYIDGQEIWLHPDKSWKSHALNKEQPLIKMDENFYINLEKK